MTYEEKINLLSDEDFFTFFNLLHAEPTWVMSAGHHSIQLLGMCHNGHNHSALFDPKTGKVTCFSECGRGFLLHNWVGRALDLDSAQEAKDFIEEWIDGQEIDLSNRISRGIETFVYEERPFEVEDVPPLPGIGAENVQQLYSEFDNSIETLERLVWHTRDKIDANILKEFDVAYYPKRRTIILPHHNINGEIVGLYERSFLPLRKEVREKYPEIDYKSLMRFPRAKYVPLLKEAKFLKEDDEKTSWSFPNAQNLYGLHKAKDQIQETGKVIIFEGAKSVMLAHQYGYHYAVASHTFGANVKHISMLINCGAKEIIFAFDKQYQRIDDDDKEWNLYEKKTRDLAKKIGKYVNVSRIVDYFESGEAPLLEYKDAPIDRGKKAFDKLFEKREPLMTDGVEQIIRKRKEYTSLIRQQLDKITKRKVDHADYGSVETDGPIEII